MASSPVSLAEKALLLFEVLLPGAPCTVEKLKAIAFCFKKTSVASRPKLFWKLWKNYVNFKKPALKKKKRVDYF